jgi:hypothetical protein
MLIATSPLNPLSSLNYQANLRFYWLERGIKVRGANAPLRRLLLIYKLRPLKKGDRRGILVYCFAPLRKLFPLLANHHPSFVRRDKREN